MNSNLISIMIAMMLMSASLLLLDGEAGPDPVFDPDAGADVPVWNVGDFWNYTTEFEYLYLDIFSITFSGWLNMSVVSVTLDMFSNGEPIYITNLTGNLSAEDTFMFIGDVNVYIDMTGYYWNRAQDLSVYRSILNATIKGTVDSMNGDYTIGYEYSPPLEEYDFPLVPGDKWEVDTSARLPFGASGDIVPIRQNLSGGERVAVEVPAGIFHAYPVSVDGSESLFFNETVGRSVKRSFSMEELSEDIMVPFELSSFHREDYEIGVALTISEEQHIEAGDKFTLNGEVSRSNVLVNIFFHGGTLAGTHLLSMGDTDFTQILTAPIFPDDTPTTIDHGSFGIFVSVNLLEGVGAISVTTKARDLEAKNGSLSVEVQGNGTVDDVITARMIVNNPSNFRAENFSVKFDIPLREGYLFLIEELYLDGRSTFTIYHNFTVDEPGNYQARMTIDPKDEILEYNETNNEATYDFVVLDRADIIWEVSPSGGNYTLDEGEGITLQARATRGGDPLPGRWYLDGNEVLISETLRFDAEYQGPNSSREAPYLIEYMLDRGHTHPKEVNTIPYNITVRDVNRPHVFESFSPSEFEVQTLENTTLEFSVNVREPDGDELQFIWTVGNKTFSSGNNITIATEYTGPLSSDASLVEITVVVYDGRDTEINISLTWNLTILDVDRPFSAVFNPPSGNISIDHDEILDIGFNASDPDGTVVTSEWRYLGRIIPESNRTSIIIDPISEDIQGEVFDVVLILRSGTMNMTTSWNVEVKEPPSMTPPGFEPVPPKGVSILSPVMGEKIDHGEDILLSAVSGDTRNLSFVWTLGEKSLNGSEVLLEPMEPGNYTVYLNVSSMDDNAPGWIEISVDFVVREPVIIEEDPEGDDEDGFVGWMIILMIAILLIIIAAMVLFMRKRQYFEE